MSKFELIKLSVKEEPRQKMELRMKPITPPVTPPELAPGVEYLEGSPFSGNKSVTKLPPDPYDGTAPNAPRFSVPCRLVPEWVEPGGGGGTGVVSWTIPRHLREITQTKVGDYTVHIEYIDTEVKNTVWPPPGSDGFPFYTTNQLPVPIEDFLEQQLCTDLVILNIIWQASPSYQSYYLNRQPDNLIITPDELNPYGLWAEGYDNGLTSQALKHNMEDGHFYTVYSVPLFVKGGDLNNWQCTSDNTYDVRQTLFDAIDNPAVTHPFIVYLRRCRANNQALNTWLNHLANIETTLVAPEGRSYIYASLEFVADTKVNMPDYQGTATITFMDAYNNSVTINYVHGTTSPFVTAPGINFTEIVDITADLGVTPDGQALFLYALVWGDGAYVHATYPDIPKYDGFYWVNNTRMVEVWYIGTTPPDSVG